MKLIGCYLQATSCKFKGFGAYRYLTHYLFYLLNETYSSICIFANFDTEMANVPENFFMGDMDSYIPQYHGR